MVTMMLSEDWKQEDWKQCSEHERLFHKVEDYYTLITHTLECDILFAFVSDQLNHAVADGWESIGVRALHIKESWSVPWYRRRAMCSMKVCQENLKMYTKGRRGNFPEHNDPTCCSVIARVGLKIFPFFTILDLTKKKRSFGFDWGGLIAWKKKTCGFDFFGKNCSNINYRIRRF